jgi:hypothetical protein
MVKFDWLKYCFHAYFLTWIIGAFIEIKYHNYSPYIFGAVIILMIAFSIGAMMEVWNGGLRRGEKITYTLGFIFINFLAAILFMMNRAKINQPAEPEK